MTSLTNPVVDISDENVDPPPFPDPPSMQQRVAAAAAAVADTAPTSPYGHHPAPTDGAVVVGAAAASAVATISATADNFGKTKSKQTTKPRTHFH